MEKKSDFQSGYKIISFLSKNIPSQYLPVIKDPFLKTLRYGNDYFKLIDHDAYYKAYSKYIDFLLEKPNSQTKIAFLNDLTILGWCLFEEETLHYIWVKKEVRQQNIAKNLLPKEIKVFTHITNKAINIWIKDNYNHMRFNPFA